MAMKIDHFLFVGCGMLAAIKASRLDRFSGENI
jgi:hypothetical protein